MSIGLWAVKMLHKLKKNGMLSMVKYENLITPLYLTLPSGLILVEALFVA